MVIAVTITIAFYRFHSGVTPSRVSPQHLFYLSDLVSPLFFVNLPTKIFPSGVTPMEGVTRGGPPPPSDATAVWSELPFLVNMNTVLLV